MTVSAAILTSLHREQGQNLKKARGIEYVMSHFFLLFVGED